MLKALAVHLLARIAAAKAGMNPSPCVFCKIANNQSASDVLYRDQLVTAFRDVRPTAPTHLLVIPNRHIASLNDARPQDEALLGHMFLVARQLAGREGIDQSGYRIILNTGPDGGQTIYHLHLHLIGGQRMRHPIG